MQYVEAFEYRAPQQVAKTVGELYPEQSQREKVRILDVAAGTGLVGVEVSSKSTKGNNSARQTRDTTTKT